MDNRNGATPCRRWTSLGFRLSCRKIPTIATATWPTNPCGGVFNWEQVRDAKPPQVVQAIRIAGLANQKGPRIQTVLREITAERGALDLGFLADLSVEEAHTWPTHFKGVGPKTAAIVLVFSLGKPAFPVDTHVYRVSGRIGLRPDKMSVEVAHTHLAGLFPPEEFGPAHLI